MVDGSVLNVYIYGLQSGTIQIPVSRSIHHTTHKSQLQSSYIFFHINDVRISKYDAGSCFEREGSDSIRVVEHIAQTSLVLSFPHPCCGDVYLTFLSRAETQTALESQMRESQIQYLFYYVCRAYSMCVWHLSLSRTSAGRLMHGRTERN